MIGISAPRFLSKASKDCKLVQKKIKDANENYFGE